MENKCKSIPYSLNCPPSSILCLCISFVSLFLLSNISNSHTPTLGHENTIKADPQQMAPSVGPQQMPINMGSLQMTHECAASGSRGHMMDTSDE